MKGNKLFEAALSSCALHAGVRCDSDMVFGDKNKKGKKTFTLSLCLACLQPFEKRNNQNLSKMPRCHGNTSMFRLHFFSCSDVDECLSSPCHDDANCTNTAGAFHCHCNPGLTGDGFLNCKGKT